MSAELVIERQKPTLSSETRLQATRFAFEIVGQAQETLDRTGPYGRFIVIERTADPIRIEEALRDSGWTQEPYPEDRCRWLVELGQVQHALGNQKGVEGTIRELEPEVHLIGRRHSRIVLTDQLIELRGLAAGDAMAPGFSERGREERERTQKEARVRERRQQTLEDRLQKASSRRFPSNQDRELIEDAVALGNFRIAYQAATTRSYYSVELLMYLAEQLSKRGYDPTQTIESAHRMATKIKDHDERSGAYSTIARAETNLGRSVLARFTLLKGLTAFENPPSDSPDMLGGIRRERHARDLFNAALEAGQFDLAEATIKHLDQSAITQFQAMLNIAQAKNRAGKTIQSDLDKIQRELVDARSKTHMSFGIIEVGLLELRMREGLGNQEAFEKAREIHYSNIYGRQSYGKIVEAFLEKGAYDEALTIANFAGREQLNHLLTLIALGAARNHRYDIARNILESMKLPEPWQSRQFGSSHPGLINAQLQVAKVVAQDAFKLSQITPSFALDPSTRAEYINDQYLSTTGTI